MTTPTRSKDQNAILAVADAVGGLMEFWGFKRNMGRMWTVLYLAAEPLSAAELADRLSLSAGAVSMTATALGQWGVVRKISRTGERRDYYEPETNIWKMVSRVFRDRELKQIDVAIGAFERARVALRERLDTAPAPERKQLEFVIARIDGLYELAQLGRRLLSGLLAGQHIENPLKGID